MESEEKYYVIQLTKSPGDYRNYVYGPYDKDDAEKICKKRHEIYSEEYKVFITLRVEP